MSFIAYLSQRHRKQLKRESAQGWLAIERAAHYAGIIVSRCTDEFEDIGLLGSVPAMDELSSQILFAMLRDKGLEVIQTHDSDSGWSVRRPPRKR